MYFRESFESLISVSGSQLPKQERPKGALGWLFRNGKEYLRKSKNLETWSKQQKEGKLQTTWIIPSFSRDCHWLWIKRWTTPTLSFWRRSQTQRSHYRKWNWGLVLLWFSQSEVSWLRARRRVMEEERTSLSVITNWRWKKGNWKGIDVKTLCAHLILGEELIFGSFFTCETSLAFVFLLC